MRISIDVLFTCDIIQSQLTLLIGLHFWFEVHKTCKLKNTHSTTTTTTTEKSKSTKKMSYGDIVSANNKTWIRKYDLLAFCELYIYIFLSIEGTSINHQEICSHSQRQHYEHQRISSVFRSYWSHWQSIYIIHIVCHILSFVYLLHSNNIDISQW